jgi:hypothetical protein
MENPEWGCNFYKPGKTKSLPFRWFNLFDRRQRGSFMLLFLSQNGILWAAIKIPSQNFY